LRADRAARPSSALGDMPQNRNAFMVNVRP
jgi:hypothetical protein